MLHPLCHIASVKDRCHIVSAKAPCYILSVTSSLLNPLCKILSVKHFIASSTSSLLHSLCYILYCIHYITSPWRISLLQMCNIFPVTSCLSNHPCHFVSTSFNSFMSYALFQILSVTSYMIRHLSYIFNDTKV